MKTLIENLTSDLLPNQIFQTGFSFLIILKGNSLLKLDSNVLIFIMSGTMKVSSAQQELATVRERHIFFWDKKMTIPARCFRTHRSSYLHLVI